jgi:hypothetical protein
MMKTRRFVNTALMTLITAILSSSTVPVSSENINGWNYRLIVTIDNTDNPQGLIDYQVLVELDSSNFNFSQVQPDGDDLRFTNQNGDILPYWIEFYDPASKKAKIWVKVDSIPASDTTSIIMYYGNPGALDTSDFDTTFTRDSVHEGLVALWHMDEGSGTTITDSSGNGNNGTFHADGSPAWVGSDGGRWDGITQQFSTRNSLNFDGIDDYVSILSVADNIVNPDTVFVFWAKGSGLDISECQPFIETADGLVEGANKFYSSGNYIAANNLALQAINLYEQIIEILEDFLP